MDNENKPEENANVENEDDIKVDELGDENLDEASGGDNGNCNCNCGIE